MTETDAVDLSRESAVGESRCERLCYSFPSGNGEKFSVIVYGYAPLKAKSDCNFAIIRVVPRFKIVPDSVVGDFLF